MECNFSEEEVRRMRGLLDANDPVPADEPGAMRRRDHVASLFCYPRKN